MICFNPAIHFSTISILIIMKLIFIETKLSKKPKKTLKQKN